MSRDKISTAENNAKEEATAVVMSRQPPHEKHKNQGAGRPPKTRDQQGRVATQTMTPRGPAHCRGPFTQKKPKRGTNPPKGNRHPSGPQPHQQRAPHKQRLPTDRQGQTVGRTKAKAHSQTNKEPCTSKGSPQIGKGK